MKGIVFTELLEMVEDGHGIESVDQLLDTPGLTDNGAYTSVGTYQYSELSSLVVCLSEILEVPPNDLLRDFGKHLFTRFAGLYPDLFYDGESWQVFLGRVHNSIHVEVRKLYPDAELPNFKCWVDGDVVIMEYDSARPMASFAEGLIMGCLLHHGVDCEVTCELLGERDGRSARFKIK